MQRWKWLRDDCLETMETSKKRQWLECRGGLGIFVDVEECHFLRKLFSVLFRKQQLPSCLPGSSRVTWSGSRRRCFSRLVVERLTSLSPFSSGKSLECRFWWAASAGDSRESSTGSTSGSPSDAPSSSQYCRPQRAARLLNTNKSEWKLVRVLKLVMNVPEEWFEEKAHRWCIPVDVFIWWSIEEGTHHLREDGRVLRQKSLTYSLVFVLSQRALVFGSFSNGFSDGLFDRLSEWELKTRRKTKVA